MARDRKIGFWPSRVPNARFIMVIVGIALFVVGFVVTVESLSHTNEGRAHKGSDVPLSVDSENFGGEAELLVLVGIMTSLAGVVIATVGPAVSMMRSRDRVER